ncbi:hypothetical protein D3C85_1605490 [compost metagenome]
MQLLLGFSQLRAGIALGGFRHLGASFLVRQCILQAITLLLQRGFGRARCIETFAQLPHLLLLTLNTGLCCFQALGSFVMLPVSLVELHLQITCHSFVIL